MKLPAQATRLLKLAGVASAQCALFAVWGFVYTSLTWRHNSRERAPDAQQILHASLYVPPDDLRSRWGTYRI